MTHKQLQTWFENNNHKFIFYNLKDSNDTEWLKHSSTLYNTKNDYKTEWLLNGLLQSLNPPADAEPFTNFNHLSQVLINKARYGTEYVSIKYELLMEFDKQDKEYLFCIVQPRMFTSLFKQSTFLNV
jgi:hypothetical protein